VIIRVYADRHAEPFVARPASNEIRSNFFITTWRQPFIFPVTLFNFQDYIHATLILMGSMGSQRKCSGRLHPLRHEKRAFAGKMSVIELEWDILACISFTLSVMAK
jgi:hypothetical protein